MTTDLLKRLEAGEISRELDAEVAALYRYHPYGPYHWLDASPELAFRPTSNGWLGAYDDGKDTPRSAWAAPCYTTSLDAAVALVERVFPGCYPSMAKLGPGWEANIRGNEGRFLMAGDEEFYSIAPTPAAALIAALLKAEG